MEITDDFGGMYSFYLQTRKKQKQPERCQHLIGWIWEQLASEPICPEIFPDVALG